MPTPATASPVIPASPLLPRPRVTTPQTAPQLREVLPADVSTLPSTPIALKCPYEIPDIAQYPRTSDLPLGLPDCGDALRPFIELTHQYTE